MTCPNVPDTLGQEVVRLQRGSNIASTEPLRLSTTPQVIALLDQIAGTGLYGKNRAEVAEEMLRTKLREAIREGITAYTLPEQTSAPSNILTSDESRELVDLIRKPPKPTDTLRRAMARKR